ncbi:MAG: hypothetical protein UH853_04235 [Muribaculaceae bacterium]|nr:hypothetical protein [Muribaculaceae bacterium]
MIDTKVKAHRYPYVATLVELQDAYPQAEMQLLIETMQSVNHPQLRYTTNINKTPMILYEQNLHRH